MPMLVASNKQMQPLLLAWPDTMLSQLLTATNQLLLHTDSSSQKVTQRQEACLVKLHPCWSEMVIRHIRQTASS